MTLPFGEGGLRSKTEEVVNSLLSFQLPLHSALFAKRLFCKKKSMFLFGSILAKTIEKM